MSTPLGHNLRRFRDDQGLSQAKVAERAGISRVAYRNIETGAVTPRARTLARLGDALGVRTPDLMVEARPIQAVRFRERGMTSREQLLIRVGRWLEDYGELERLLRSKRSNPFFKARSSAQGLSGQERARKLAAAARSAIDLGPDEPIRDICGLLEDHGVKIHAADLASEGFFGLSVAEQDGGPAIVVNVWDRISVERRIFTAAHELGHLLLHLDAYKVHKRIESAEEENEADTFAAYFLMPEKVFEREWDEARGLSFVERVLKVKRIFHVSYLTVLRRVSDTTPLGKSARARFGADYQALTGRTLSIKDEPERLKPGVFRSAMSEARLAEEPERLSPREFTEDRLSRLVRDAIEKRLITIGRGAEILGRDLGNMRKLVASWVA